MSKVLEEISKQRFFYPKLERHLVELSYNLTDFLDLSDYGAIFCPFHDDVSGGKKSAKFFKDDDGVQRIYCFAERKQFSSYDYIRLLQHQDPIQMLIKEIPEKEILDAIRDYIQNAGRFEMRKTKLTKKYKTMSEKEFIRYISFGT